MSPLPCLADTFGRHVTYLRVSVTDRCDLRCGYCMSETVSFLPKADILSLEELDQACAAFARLGVRRFRLTGGEPLMRRDVLELVRALGRRRDAGELDEITLTTNGTRLAEFAADLAEAGVGRINVSLDSLDPARFAAITHGGDVARVLNGIEAAQNAGIKLKINTVALRGMNEPDFSPLLAWCGERGLDLVFIEAMPMGGAKGTLSGGYLPVSAVREVLTRSWNLEDTDYRTNGPARYARCVETGTRVGFIAPLSRNFCAFCTRVRLTCTGDLYTCLGRENRTPLRELLRSGDQAALDLAIQSAVRDKPQGHDFNERLNGGHLGPRPMSTTGG